MKILLNSGLILLTVFLFSCKEKNRFHIQQFENPVTVNIQRFDLAFLNLDTENAEQGLLKLREAYPDFFDLFFNEGLWLHPDSTSSNATMVSSFLNDEFFSEVHRKHREVLPDASSMEKDLSVAFSYIHHYFPDLVIPEFYFFASGFNHQHLITENILGVGADLYLGSDFEPYRELTHDYLIEQMTPRRIVPELLYEYFQNQFRFNAETNLLNAMIHEGKLMYLAGLFLPGYGIEDLMGYNREELKWCRHYGRAAWTRMLENKDLFSTDPLLISKYIGIGPFTSPISQDSPGRMGIWFGWQIVQSFMQNNKEVNLQQLMYELPNRSIFERSGFRP